MGLKDTFDKAVDAVGNAAKDTRDSVNESRHKGAADAEHAKRDVAGDQMSVGENLRSMGNEAKNNVQAGVSETKRETRDTTT